LTRHRSLRAFLNAPRTGGQEPSGLGVAAYCRVQAALELSRRHYAEALRCGPALDSPATTRQFLITRLRDSPHELFCCLHLDNRHRLIAFDELFRGTIDGASVHPREVVKQALARNAAAVILAHNHPSGVAEPSQADELITHRLRDALQLVDIRLLDHLIVADNGCLSFAERGLI
jgi:DNA repair protein RadC